MFGTLKYNPSGNKGEFIDRTSSWLGNAASEYSACDSCRAKKVKCSGERSGCDRCKSVQTNCVYSTSAVGAGGSRLRKRACSPEPQQWQQQQEPNQNRPPSQIGHGSTSRQDRQKNAHGQNNGNRNGSSQQPEQDLPRQEQLPSPPASSHQQQQQQQQQPISEAALTSPIRSVAPPLETQSMPYDSLDVSLGDEFLSDLVTDMDSSLGAFSDTFAGAGQLSIGEDGSIDSGSEFDFLAPVSLPLPTISGIAFATTQPPASAPPAPPQAAAEISTPCSCLTTIVGLLEELDELAPAAGPCISYATLDEVLAAHKSSVSQAIGILRCTRCRARSEHMALLTRVCEGLTRLCERIVTAYLEPVAVQLSGNFTNLSMKQQQQQQTMHQHHTCNHHSLSQHHHPTGGGRFVQQQRTTSSSSASTNTPTPATSSSSSNLSTCMTVVDSSCCASALQQQGQDHHSASSSSSSSSSLLFCGRYQTDPSEWECLVRVLICIQMHALANLLAGVRRCSLSAANTVSTLSSPAGPSPSRLHEAELLVRALANRLQGSVRGRGKLLSF
ncbi:hypothetical protein QBC46DRAFT_444405 [Diplogelasinospora grovesii]|uniref:Zn(2)-C6 fungal-type domain-containing protein n=1 Tax=Diplogelasinospora grovesii TaxID=303347 RepID=A0AAN6NMA7_9PEZI|nr:hypothetical protein QBC46DRAFT_444405 [Diplogelasinospora grovesii]